MAKRKGISKRVRFEIFKRDGFGCAYCGRAPPDVLLHVDHILAVANGGENEPTNLTTACADCNGGKAAVALTSVAPSLRTQAEEAKERAEQVRAYSELLLELRRDREETAEILYRSYSDNLEWPRGWQGLHLLPQPERTATVIRFMEHLTVAEILEAVEIAKHATNYKPHLTPTFRTDGEIRQVHDDNRWRYFCGVCWKKIRDREERANG